MKIKIKIILVIILLPLVLFKSSSDVNAETSVDSFRITYNGKQQNGPIIYKDVVMWTDWRGPGGLNIYAYNFKTKTEYPVIISEYHDRVAGHNEHYVLYNHILPGGDYKEIRVLDLRTNEDYKVLDATVYLSATSLYHDKFTYLHDGADGDLYVYDLKTKQSQLIDNGYCSGPKIYGNYIAWTISTGPGWYDVKAFDLVKNQFINLPPVPEGSFRSLVDFYKGQVIMNQFQDGERALISYDLKNGKMELLHQGPRVGRAAISENYLVWGRSTDKHIARVEGMDLKTGEIFEIMPQGPQSNAAVGLSIYKNTVVWMAWRTGNGDIYGAELIRE